MNNEQRTMNNEKRRNKKNVLYSLSFFSSLFSFFFCIVACQNPFEPPKTEKSAEVGYFSLTLREPGAGRTIMPVTVQSDFAVYTLEFFTNGTTTSPVESLERTNANLSAPIQLNPGTWDLHVSAYMDAAKTKLVARGSLAGIVIGAGENVNRSVTLLPIVDGDSTGTFSWNINYPPDVTEATMTITRLFLPTETELVETITFNGALPQTGSRELLTGYYRLVFKLENNEGLKIERRETLHIYQNMESAFSSTFRFLTPHDIELGIENFGPGAIVSNIFNVADTIDWNEAVSFITNGGNDKNYIIIITGDFDVTASTANTFGNVSDVKVSLRSEGSTLTLSGNGNMLRIGSDQTLLLNGLILQGHDLNDNSLVYVSGGTLTMNSGEISGNSIGETFYSGGGVYVSDGTFTMNGGVISDNIATNNGGEVYVRYSTFTMNGGEISGNTGNGVYVRDSTFTMNGGEISGNTGYGVFVWGATFAMNGGDISGNGTTHNGGGAVYLSLLDATFTMSGGKISGNTTGTGAVYIDSGGIFTMQDGEISGNTGAGVWLSSNNVTFTMNGGEISGNLPPSTGGGGGVRVVAIYSTFTMNDGKISGNTTSTSGGGVYVNAANSTFTMNGGEISGNKASSPGTGFNTHGGGVYVESGTFRIVTGTIYGLNETDTNLRNTAIRTYGETIDSAAFYGIAEYGTFNNGEWHSKGYLETFEYTIKVENGELTNISPIPDNNEFNVASTDDWNDAIISITALGRNKDLTINVMADFPIEGRRFNTFGYITGIKVTIRGNGQTLSLSSYGSILRIRSNQTVVTQDLTLRGGANTHSLVYVSGINSAFTMNSGEISDNIIFATGGTTTSDGYFTSGGSGVHVSGGTFTMNGGKISGNDINRSSFSGDLNNDIGGGVYITGDGTFRIVTGIIYGSNEADANLRNTARYMGSALYKDTNCTVQRGTFSGGTWVSQGDLNTTNNTIKVAGGALQ